MSGQIELLLAPRRCGKTYQAVLWVKAGRDYGEHGGLSNNRTIVTVHERSEESIKKNYKLFHSEIATYKSLALYPDVFEKRELWLDSFDLYLMRKYKNVKAIGGNSGSFKLYDSVDALMQRSKNEEKGIFW